MKSTLRSIYYILACVLAIVLSTSFVFAESNPAAENICTRAGVTNEFVRKDFAEDVLKRHLENTEPDNPVCKDTDVCDGKVTNEHTFLHPYYFRTRADKSVPVWSYPWTGSYAGTESSVVKRLDPDVRVSIDGIVRNQEYNLWLHVKDAGYVYIENVLYEYDANLALFYQYVSSHNEQEYDILFFYDCVKPNSYGDIKRWLDPGGKSTKFKVIFNDNCQMLTAESLGNLTYGSLGTMIGIGENELLYAGGAINFTTHIWEYTLNPNDLAILCISSYCDAPNDVRDIKAGIRYINNY